MWRPGISNGLAIPYAVCIHVRTSLTSSATSLSERSVPAAWVSLVDWRAFVRPVARRSQMDPFVYSGLALNIRIHGELNNNGLAILSFIGITFSWLRHLHLGRWHPSSASRADSISIDRYPPPLSQSRELSQ